MAALRRRVSLGRVHGHRGGKGEITIRVGLGPATPWSALKRVVLAAPSGEESAHDVESARAYRNSLVLKLRGVDDATRAAAFRGWRLEVEAEEAWQAVGGEPHPLLLVGFEVRDEAERRLGWIRGAMATGGPDLLVVADEAGEEVLIPLVGEIVRGVDAPGGIVRIHPPRGLLELNRRGERS